MVTPHGQHKTYSIILEKRYFNEIDWKDLTEVLKNVHLSPARDKQTTILMSNSGDLLGFLPQSKMTDILFAILRGGSTLPWENSGSTP